MLFPCRAALFGVALVMLTFCGCSQKWRFTAPNPNGRLAARQVDTPVTENLEPTGVAVKQDASSLNPGASRPGASLKPQPPTQMVAGARQVPQSAFPSQVGGPMGPPPQWQQAPPGPYVGANYGAMPNVGTNPNAPFGVAPAPTYPQPPQQFQPPPQQPQMPVADPQGPGTLAPVASGSSWDMIRPVRSTLRPASRPLLGAREKAPCVESPCAPPREKRPFFHPRTWCSDVCGDYRNYYTWRNATGYFYSIAGASLLANTSLDDDFRDWYQRDARTEESDNFAAFWKTFGEGEYVVPFFLCTAAAGKALERFPIADVVGEHGYRTSRAYLVGFPPMLFSQHLLGGSRPTEVPHESMWRPFEDNNAVSGHAFMGAVPFITAAQMTDSRLLKFGFYTLSTFPAWSRVNDDAHFASQVCLGWYMAYMACSSVNKTSDPNRNFEVMPMVHPGGTGIMAIWKR
ncbi:MAG: phosphatase PAP2 family protein [Planctomycetia bacterium]|jgi:hypothetical protein